MKKVLEFLKTNTIIVKWTLEYFVVLGLILKFLFNFNVFSAYHWWKFYHATLHGFGGLVFGLLMYSAIPIYIASVLIIYRKKEPIFTISIYDKTKSILERIKNLFIKPEPITSEEENQQPEIEPESASDEIEYPTDMPREMYASYIRAKQHIPLHNATSIFNKVPEPGQNQTQPNPENESFPIPSDFDISDSLPENQMQPDFSNSGFPVFKDIDFDKPISQPADEFSNSVTKYCEQHAIEYETYHDFVATEKYVIYDHNDGDFWIMDDDSWFASKKQKASPINELLELAQQNDLIPILYLESQNIMDLPGTTERFESMGIRVIKNLDELK